MVVVLVLLVGVLVLYIYCAVQRLQPVLKCVELLVLVILLHYG
jgi:hypothetical protein